MNSKIVVIYKSSTGFTKKYAEMIADESGAVLLDITQASVKKLSGVQTLVFGGRLHAGSIDGLKKARKLFRACGAERFIVFATGAAPNAAEDVIRNTWKKNLSAEELKSVPHFYMQAGLCYEKMGFIDRSMMKMLSRMLASKKEKTPEDQAFAETIAKSFDISDRKYIQPLLEILK